MPHARSSLHLRNSVVPDTSNNNNNNGETDLDNRIIRNKKQVGTKTQQRDGVTFGDKSIKNQRHDIHCYLTKSHLHSVILLLERDSRASGFYAHAIELLRVNNCGGDRNIDYNLVYKFNILNGYLIGARHLGNQSHICSIPIVHCVIIIQIIIYFRNLLKSKTKKKITSVKN